MVNFSEWLVEGLIDGYEEGLTHFAKVTELTGNYLAKGLITQAQADKVALACPKPTKESEV